MKLLQESRRDTPTAAAAESFCPTTPRLKAIVARVSRGASGEAPGIRRLTQGLEARKSNAKQKQKKGRFIYE